MADATTPQNTAAAPTTPDEVQKYRSEQEKEYGQYVAVEAISFNGAAAYNPGDPVPASNVAKYGYDADGSVAKLGTKKGADAIAAVQAAAAPVVESVVITPVSLNVPQQ